METFSFTTTTTTMKWKLQTSLLEQQPFHTLLHLLLHHHISAFSWLLSLFLFPWRDSSERKRRDSNTTSPQHSWGTMDWVVSNVNKEMNISSLPNNVTVIFILGGPGSGKSTQCSKITQLYGFTHISTSDLLRMEKESSYSQHSAMIRNKMNEGKLVPSDVMVNLLERAMVQSGDDKFLIDGFPCNLENIAEWRNSMGVEPEFLLYLDCPKEVMANRVLTRNEGRIDDNMDALLKRIEVFEKDSPFVVEYCYSKGKLRKIHAERSRDEVFEEIKGAFSDFEMSVSC